MATSLPSVKSTPHPHFANELHSISMRTLCFNIFITFCVTSHQDHRVNCSLSWVNKWRVSTQCSQIDQVICWMPFGIDLALTIIIPYTHFILIWGKYGVYIAWMILSYSVVTETVLILWPLRPVSADHSFTFKDQACDIAMRHAKMSHGCGPIRWQEKGQRWNKYIYI